MNKLIIIGAGPAGYETAIKAKMAGMDVTLIEKNELGGVCLFEGCIPTKTLLQSAKVYQSAQEAAKFGVNVDKVSLDYQTVMLRKSGVIFRLNEGIKFRMEEKQIRVIRGEAHIVNSHQVKVNDELLTTDYIMIATGSHCRSLAIPDSDLPNVIHARDLLSLNVLPKSIGIIGSGVIGCELASIFNGFGSHITILEMQDNILPLVDQEISKRLSVAFKRAKIDMKTGVKVQQITQNGNLLNVEYLEKNQLKRLEVEYVLVAVGRQPNVNVDELNHLGIQHQSSGIIVDHNFKTNINHIYAIGDVNGKSLLAHSAIFQGEVALHHILNKQHEIHFDLTPNVIFTLPEIAYVGLKENQLTQGEYKVYRSLYSANGKATTLDETFGFAKILTDLNGVILGAHIIGVQASILIAELVIALQNKMTLHDFKQVIHAHPTLSEIWQDLH